MAGQGDMKAHQKTYDGVMNLMKWGTVVTVVLAFIVVLLIAN